MTLPFLFEFRIPHTRPRRMSKSARSSRPRHGRGELPRRAHGRSSRRPREWREILPPPPSARPADRCSSSCQADTSSPCVSRAEHGRVAKHVGHNEEADVGAADVDLVEMGDAAVAGGDGYVFELDVHVVFGCSIRQYFVSFKGVWRVVRTFEELAAVGRARCDFEGDDVALRADR